MTRGFVRIPGLAAFTLAVGMVVIAGNIRDLEAWVANAIRTVETRTIRCSSRLTTSS